MGEGGKDDKVVKPYGPTWISEDEGKNKTRCS